MTGRLGENILKLLVHTLKRSAIINMWLEDLSNVVIDVLEVLEVEDLTHIMPRIAEIWKSQARLDVVEKSKAILA